MEALSTNSSTFELLELSCASCFCIKDTTCQIPERQTKVSVSEIWAKATTWKFREMIVIRRFSTRSITTPNKTNPARVNADNCKCSHSSTKPPKRKDGWTLQPEVITRIILQAFFHVAEMIFSQKHDSKTIMHSSNHKPTYVIDGRLTHKINLVTYVTEAFEETDPGTKHNRGNLSGWSAFNWWRQGHFLSFTLWIVTKLIPWELLVRDSEAICAL